MTRSQVGLITFAYQATASLLQPLVGLYADRKPTPLALPGGTLFSLAGLAVLSIAHGYSVLLLGACLLGLGSSVLHPESSRVARMASGGRHGMTQALFQVGGNLGQALGPLAAALVVVRWGQSSLAAFACLALLSGAILYNVSLWYRRHGLARLHAKGASVTATHARARRSITILLALIFSKYVYLASLTSYFTFYLIQRFHVSVQHAQLQLFAFLAAVAVGTVLGGPLGDRFGRRRVIWIHSGRLAIHAAAPACEPLLDGSGDDCDWPCPRLRVPGHRGLAQELVPGKVGMISGLFFGFSFGMGGLGAAVLGRVADATSIETVYAVCAFLPAIGLLAAMLPNVDRTA